jgi:hypothetical protein
MIKVKFRTRPMRSFRRERLASASVSTTFSVPKRAIDFRKQRRSVKGFAEKPAKSLGIGPLLIQGVVACRDKYDRQIRALAPHALAEFEAVDLWQSDVGYEEIEHLQFAARQKGPG